MFFICDIQFSAITYYCLLRNVLFSQFKLTLNLPYFDKQKFEQIKRLAREIIHDYKLFMITVF